MLLVNVFALKGSRTNVTHLGESIFMDTTDVSGQNPFGHETKNENIVLRSYRINNENLTICHKYHNQTSSLPNTNASVAYAATVAFCL